MSNERFDRLMKKNLESVRPAYQPRAWDRFQKRLPAVGLWPWLAQYGGWVLSGLMLIGWLMTGYTLRENQQLVRTLIRPTVHSAPLRQTVLAEGKITHRIDTVYIVKRTIIEYRSVQNKVDVSTARRTTGPSSLMADNILRRKQEPRTGKDVHQADISQIASLGLDSLSSQANGSQVGTKLKLNESTKQSGPTGPRSTAY